MSKTAQIKNAQGFTLVELLIVISILVIVTGAAIPSFAGYIKNQGIKQAQEQLKSDLRNIQNKALTGALSDQTIGTSPVAYWGVRFSPGSGSGATRYEYFIAATNTSCPSGALPSSQLQGYSDLASGIIVRASAYTCVYFSIANGSISSSPSVTQLIVGYSGSTASGDCRRVHFNSNGLIYSGTSLLCT